LKLKITFIIKIRMQKHANDSTFPLSSSLALSSGYLFSKITCFSTQNGRNLRPRTTFIMTPALFFLRLKTKITSYQAIVHKIYNFWHRKWLVRGPHLKAYQWETLDGHLGSKLTSPANRISSHLLISKCSNRKSDFVIRLVGEKQSIGK